MANEMYDLVVIGSGPGGYIAAVRAAQLGLKVACVEKSATLGGTCLNVGCIPSKALLESSELYSAAQHEFATHGIGVGAVTLDLAAMLARKDKIVGELTRGVAYLFNKNKVEWLKGHGVIAAPGRVEVRGPDGSVAHTVETRRILIATGSAVATLRGIELDGERIVSSTEALSFPTVPEHLIVIGAGVIGLELGSVWKRLGAKVTVVEYLPRILAASDGEIARHALRVFKRQGLEFALESKVTAVERDGDRVRVTYEDRTGVSHTLEGDRVLVAVGRKPYTEGLGLEAVGVKLDERGRIPVDGNFETNVAGIYAIGDVTPGAMLAHKAEHEGVVAVERMVGMGSHINYLAIPDVVYTWPEVAGIGRTEEQLQKDGVKYRVGKFPFQPNGRAKALGTTDGLVKVLADERTDELLGCHILGPRAGDLISEIAVAMEFGASSEDVARTTHPHPSLSEVVKEAALAVDGRALNA